MKINVTVGLYAKSLTFIVTYVLNQVVFNPVEFAQKLKARFRAFQAAESFLAKSKLQLGSSRGATSQVMRKNTPKRGPRRFGLNANLTCGAIQSKPFSREKGILLPGPRILYSITNSAPHTLSGYTVRTEALVQGLVREGAYVVSATRFGYPLVIGKFPRSNPEEVGEVDFYRNFSWVFPLSHDSRVQHHRKFLENVARHEEIDVLVATSDFRNAVPTSLAARDLDIPWVYEVRGHPELTWLSKSENRTTHDKEFLSMQEQELQAAKAAARVMVLSEASKNYLVELGVDKGKISIVPNSFESRSNFDEEMVKLLRKQTGLEGQFVLGTISSLVDYEGLDTMIRALRYLPDNFSCVIVGDGECRGKLELLSLELGLGSRVNFIGKVPPREVSDWYALLDVFVLPRKDTLVTRVVTPVKAMQAMAIGTPVIASNLPAIREVTGGFATYFAPGNAEALANAIIKARDGMNYVPISAEFESWKARRTWNDAARNFIKAVS